MTNEILRVVPDKNIENRSLGTVEWLGSVFDCTLGQNGIKAGYEKIEGDGATPTGLFHPLKIWYRADRVDTVASRLPLKIITKNHGWCDAPDHKDYNQAVGLPFSESHERLWRADHCYDLLIELDHNQQPTKPGKGSAIFIHIANEQFGPTRGCIGLKKRDLLDIVRELSPKSTIRIHGRSP